MVDVSGVEIGPGVRLLVPEDGSRPLLFHEQPDGEWCETKLPKSALRGSFAAGNMFSPKALVCSGLHVAGIVIGGAWTGTAVPKDATDG